jgi:cytochrome P450
LDSFVEAGGGDWVSAVAAPIPIGVICDIMGIPEEDHDLMIEMTDHLVEGTSSAELDPGAYGNTRPLRELPFNSPAAHGVEEYARNARRQRLDNPTGDLLSELATAEVDGERLSETEYARFFQLMIFAGNETTRTAIIHGGLAFAQQPDQWDALRGDPELAGSAVDEVIRWASPILHMRRTASRDTVLAGTAIAAGDKVVMWYAAANRDPEVFDEPFRFDVTRSDNPHFAFGGGGPHFCLGAFLAKMEIQVLLEEMVGRGIRLEQRAEPVRLASNFVHGVESLQLGVMA